jgi:hypothetical protein
LKLLVKIGAAVGGILTASWRFSATPTAYMVKNIVKVTIEEHPNKHHSIG